MKSAYEQKCLDTFERELDAFLARKTGLPNLHIHGLTLITVYARKAYHHIEGSMQPTLDIASIVVNRPGSGLGSKVLDMMHEKNPFPVTYIENILNPRFFQFLMRTGWIDIPYSDPPCVYKLTRRS